MEGIESIQRMSEYNKEPITYCKKCLSLAIRIIDESDYCDDCGNTETAVMDIKEWEELYEQKNGTKFLNRK